MAVTPTRSRRRRTTAAPSTELVPADSGASSLVASAAPVSLENLGWDSPRARQPWQRELWRLLDIIGELRYSAGWVASHFSRATLKIHDVDENGEIGAETKNSKARKIGAAVLGGPAQRRENMRMAGFNLWLVGEVYVGAISGAGPRKKDQWFAISSNDIQRDPGGRAYIDLGNGRHNLRPGVDMLMRSWTPHPNKASDADSTARSVRLILRELEKLTLFVFAQIDSRLASGGVFIVPAGMSLGDGTITAKDLMVQFVKTASEALKGEGTAGGIVPVVLEVPNDTVDKVKHVTFSSTLSEQAMKLREEAVKRLANNLDIPAEELTGMGDTNHWSSYQIGPDAVKKHIEPLLARLCLALQRGWVEPALEAAGLNPDKFHIWYDTTPLVVRPQRFQEALELWREGRLSAKALLEAAGFYVGDGPTAEEDVQRYLRELVLRDPQLFNQATVRELLGISKEMLPDTTGTPMDPAAAPDQQLLTDKGTPAPPPPAPEKVPQQPVTGRPPVTRERQPRGVTASGADGLDLSTDPLVLLSHSLCLRALELAGGRLLDHKTRGTLKDVPRSLLHTHIPVGDRDVDTLLSGGMETLPVLAQFCGISTQWADRLAVTLHDACVRTLRSGEPYRPERTVQMLRLMTGPIDE